MIFFSFKGSSQESFGLTFSSFIDWPSDPQEDENKRKPSALEVQVLMKSTRFSCFVFILSVDEEEVKKEKNDPVGAKLVLGHSFFLF